MVGCILLTSVVGELSIDRNIVEETNREYKYMTSLPFFSSPLQVLTLFLHYRELEGELGALGEAYRVAFSFKQR